MGVSFIESPSYLQTSESVTEGHPDKLCDQVSDAVLDALLEVDPRVRAACEVCVTNGLVVVMGEITLSHGYVDIQSLARQTLRDVGYTNAEFGMDADSCGVLVSVQEQSPDISTSVSMSLETRAIGQRSQFNEKETLGAGDQGMMVGFACNETKELMPVPIALAHRLCQRLTEVRKKGILPYLRPDGKSQVTIEYEYGIPKRIDTVIVSSHHASEVESDVMRQGIIEHVINEVLPGNLLDDSTKYYVNPSGRFVVGGPMADTGLTGRKILVDTYGGVARHGGGAFSGKDPTKVDRTGAYGARYVAKNIVASGLADRVEVLVSYAIGVSAPISISLETFGTAKIEEDKIVSFIDTEFDLRPGAIIEEFQLRRPIYKPTAAYGHFGRLDTNFPWESLRDSTGEVN